MKRKVVFFIKLFVLVGLIALQYNFAHLPSQDIIPPKYIQILIYYIIIYFIIQLVGELIIKFYVKQNKLKKVTKDNFILGVRRISTLLSFIAFIVAVLSFLDINFGQLFTSLSIVAAAIAIISKDYISNMINGMIMMFSNQVSLHDYIKIGDYKGKIMNITFTNIHILNDDDDLIYIPNNTVFTSNIVNYTKRDIKRISIDFDMSYDQIRKIEALENYLKQELTSFKNVVNEGSIRLKVIALKSDHIQLKLQYILKKNDRNIEKEIRKETIRKIVRYSCDNKD